MNQTIYFRKDIWESFKDEPDKSAVINTLLEEHYKPVEMAYEPIKKELLGNPVADLLTTAPAQNKYPDSVAQPFIPKPPDPETGYPCCTKAKPCKHWQWDGNLSAYVNELTGKEREVL